MDQIEKEIYIIKAKDSIKKNWSEEKHINVAAQ